MPNINTIRDLASRLRRDADATSDPYYESLMRRAAEEIETYSAPADSNFHQRERRAG